MFWLGETFVPVILLFKLSSLVPLSFTTCLIEKGSGYFEIEIATLYRKDQSVQQIYCSPTVCSDLFRSERSSIVTRYPVAQIDKEAHVPVGAAA